MGFVTYVLVTGLLLGTQNRYMYNHVALSDHKVNDHLCEC